MGRRLPAYPTFDAIPIFDSIHLSHFFNPASSRHAFNFSTSES